MLCVFQTKETAQKGLNVSQVFFFFLSFSPKVWRKDVAPLEWSWKYKEGQGHELSCRRQSEDNKTSFEYLISFW